MWEVVMCYIIYFTEEMSNSNKCDDKVQSHTHTPEHTYLPE